MENKQLNHRISKTVVEYIQYKKDSSLMKYFQNSASSKNNPKLKHEVKYKHGVESMGSSKRSRFGHVKKIVLGLT